MTTPQPQAPSLVHGVKSHQHGRLIKLVFTSLHAVVVFGVCFNLCFISAPATEGSLEVWLFRLLIWLYSIIYFCRVALMTFVILPRVMQWTECCVVVPWLGFVHVSFAFIATRLLPIGIGTVASPRFLAQILLALTLYIVGSVLNTASETQRFIFKRDPRNQGKLFTTGLFAYSMHINYFGDTLLFSGFALLSLAGVSENWGRAVATGVGDAESNTALYMIMFAVCWASAIPLIMTLGFIFQHIPELDHYLAQRYGEEFRVYREATPAFVPWPQRRS